MKRIACFVAAMMAFLAAENLASARSYTIATNAMTQAWDGQCSLLEAINAARTLEADHECPAGHGYDEIYLSGGTYTTTVSLAVTNTLIISGMGSIIAANFTVNRDLFVVNGENAHLAIDDTTLRNDSTNKSVLITGVYASNNATFVSNDGLRVTGFTWSGVWAANSNLNLVHARIDRNKSPSHGAGVRMDDSSTHWMYFNHSSAVFNESGGDGGGVFARSGTGAHIHYSTMANNKAVRGGGLFIDTITPGYFEGWHMSIGRNDASTSGGGIYENHHASRLELSGSVVANNTVANNAAAPTANLFRQATAGHSVDTVWGAGVTAAVLGCGAVANWSCTHNLYGQDAKFPATAMPFGGNYYSVEVLPLLKGSPAIDWGAPQGWELADQRGLNGNVDGNNNGTATSDPGSLEQNLIWEAEEILEFGSSSGDFINIEMDNGYTGALGRMLSANANNDFGSFAVYVPEAGTYEIVAKIKRASSGGKFFVGTASSLNGAYSEAGFAEQTCYSANTTFPGPITLGSRTFNGAGRYWVRMRVSGAGTGGGRPARLPGPPSAGSKSRSQR